jgi:hypothetical protein
MSWLTEVVPEVEFVALLRTIRRTGGIITGSCPCTEGYAVTYVVLDD